MGEVRLGEAWHGLALRVGARRRMAGHGKAMEGERFPRGSIPRHPRTATRGWARQVVAWRDSSRPLRAR